jgi:hypothetical protein
MTTFTENIRLFFVKRKQDTTTKYLYPHTFTIFLLLTNKKLRAPVRNDRCRPAREIGRGCEAETIGITPRPKVINKKI